MATSRQPEPPYDAVNATRLMADTESLARWVRLSGTPEELEAFRYAQRQLRAAGCRTELIRHDAYISLPGPASLEVHTDGSARQVSCVTHSFAAPTGPEALDASAVYAGGTSGTGVAATQGKIVVVDGLASPASVRAAESAGAIGLVCLNHDPYVHEMIVSTIWGSPPDDALDRLPRIPVVSVAGRDADAVRAPARSGQARLRVVTAVDTGWRKTPLLIGDLPGDVEDTFVLFVRVSQAVVNWV